MRLGLSSKWRFRRLLFIVLSILFVLLLAEIIKRLEINFLSAAEQYVSIQAAQIIDRCVAEEFSKMDADLFQVFDDDSVITDTIAINQLRSEIMIKIQDALDNELHGKVFVPLGTVLEPSLFHAVGPDVPVNIRPSGFVTSDIEEDFSSQGINQVRYSMYLDIDAEIRYTGLFLQSVAYVNTRVPVVENISIGDIPDYYGDMGILD